MAESIDSKTEVAAGAPWLWLPLGFLMLPSLYLNVTDVSDLSFQPGHLLPLLVGFLAYRFRARAVTALLIFGLFAIAAVSMPLTEYQDGALGYAAGDYMAAVVVFLIFLKRATFAGVTTTRPHRIASALAFSAVAAVAYLLPGGIELYANSEIPASARCNVATVLVVIALACLLPLRDLIRTWWSARGAGLIAGLRALLQGSATIAIMLCAMLSASVALGDDLSLRIGLDQRPVFFALCFATTVFRIVDARLIVGVLVAMIGVKLATGSPIDWLFQTDAISLVLLGACLSPTWMLSREPPPWRTALLLVAVVVLQFGVVHLDQVATGGQPLAIAGVAWCIASTWGLKGLVAAPVLLQLCALMSYAFADGEIRADVPAHLAHIGALAFPYAFVGLLTRHGVAGRGKPMAAAREACGQAS